MNPSANGHSKYQVSTSSVVVGQIKEFLQRAENSGDDERILAALREIHQRLENAPDVFGEPLYHLQSLSLDMRMGIVLPLAVTYGVNYATRIVFISRIRFLEK